MIQRSRVLAFLPGGGRVCVEGSANEVGLKAFKGVRREDMRRAVAITRLAEPADELRLHQQVLLDSNRSTKAPEAAAELETFSNLLGCAAVIADRTSRGLVRQPVADTVVLARCDSWETGELMPLDPQAGEAMLQALMEQPDLGAAQVVVASAQPELEMWTQRLAARHPGVKLRPVSSLLLFSGTQFNPLRQLGAGKVFFPVVGLPGQELLLGLRVLVSELPAGSSAEAHIEVVGTASDKTMALARHAIQTVRRLEPPSSRVWQTVVDLPSVSFDGGSFELAAVVADRMARGREWHGRGRVIASGSIDVHSNPGKVLPVLTELPADGLASAHEGAAAPRTDTKAALLAREVLKYDTVLLPKEGHEHWGLAGALREGEGSWSDPQVVLVDRVPDAIV